MKLQTISWFLGFFFLARVAGAEGDQREGSAASGGIPTNGAGQQNQVGLAEFRICLGKIGSLSKEERASLSVKYPIDGSSPFSCLVNAAIAFEEGDAVKAEQWIAIAKTIFNQKGVLNSWISALGEAGYFNGNGGNRSPQSDPLSVSGWRYTHAGSGYDWFMPDKPEGPTAWFVIEGLNTTFRVKAACLLEFQAKGSGAVTTVKYAEGKKYPMTKAGAISEMPWSEEDSKKVYMDSHAYRFKPLDNEPLLVKAGRNKNGVSQEKPSVNGWNFLSNDTGYDWFIPDNLDGPTEWFALEFFATTFRVNPGCYLDFQSNESGKVTTWKIVGGKNYAVGEDGTISSSPLSKEYIQSIFRNSRAYRFRPVEGEAMTVKVGRRD